MLPNLRYLTVVGAVLAAVSYAAATPLAHGRAVDVGPRGNVTLAEARLFRGYPLYYARLAAGHELRAIFRRDRTAPSRATTFTFIYGTCPAGTHGGCPAPVQLIMWPACYRYETRYSVPARERRAVRGVPARFTLRAGFPRLELYAARTTIVINGFGLRNEAQVLHVARALRGVNTRLSASQPLPPRPPHAGGTLRC